MQCYVNESCGPAVFGQYWHICLPSGVRSWAFSLKICNVLLQAINRMIRALDEMVILGVPTTAPFHRLIMDIPAFRAGNVDTGFIPKHMEELRVPLPPSKVGIQILLKGLAMMSQDKRREKEVAAYEVCQKCPFLSNIMGSGVQVVIDWYWQFGAYDWRFTWSDESNPAVLPHTNESGVHGAGQDVHDVGTGSTQNQGQGISLEADLRKKQCVFLEAPKWQCFSMCLARGW
jgi:Biotin carboxylase C-terminal domain